MARNKAEDTAREEEGNMDRAANKTNVDFDGGMKQMWARIEEILGKHA